MACPVITAYPSYRRKPVSVKVGLDAGRREVEAAAEYASELEFGAGFAQVAEHILRLRR